MSGRTTISDIEKCFRDFNASLSDVEKAYDQISRQIAEYNQQENVPRDYLKEMAGNLAHEIRNPLAGIAAMVELLSQETPDDQTKSIQGILHGVRRIDKIVENLIVFSQPVVFHTVQCNFGDILKRAIETTRSQLGADNDRFDFRLSGPLQPVYVQVDPVLMVQALQNMLRNAVEVMSDGGQVRLNFSHDVSNHKLMVIIEDEGPGLPQNDIEKPFYPFFTTKTYGMGLGLPTARLIIEKHGGTVSLQNRAPRGVEITLTLPIKDDGYAETENIDS